MQGEIGTTTQMMLLVHLIGFFFDIEDELMREIQNESEWCLDEKVHDKNENIDTRKRAAEPPPCPNDRNGENICDERECRVLSGNAPATGIGANAI